MNQPLEFVQKLALTYSSICKPLCQKQHLTQTAFDILLFLANNPQYQTARDIVEIRKIKANLVSVNVDRLVKEGYLRREETAGDRRKTRLLCTERALPIIEEGRRLQKKFFEMLVGNIPQEQMEVFLLTLEMLNANLDAVLEKQKEKR